MIYLASAIVFIVVLYGNISQEFFQIILYFVIILIFMIKEYNMYIDVKIGKFLNNKGVTDFKDREDGFLAFGGYSLPKECFPLNQQKYFKFHIQDEFDNMELEEQELNVPSECYTRLLLVGCSNNGDFFEDIYFYRNDQKVATKRLYFPDMLTIDAISDCEIFFTFPYIHTPNGRVEHLKPKLWLQTLEFETPIVFNTIKFGDNPSIHLFALTLLRGGIYDE
jgi:hypothetical protein